MAESEDEEIAGGERSEDIEGDSDLGQRLLRDDVRCGVVKNRVELDRLDWSRSP